MRTLKKALCLVLVLSMLAGFGVIGASAAYADADKIEYQEAVDVMSAIGVMQGIGDNTFDPNGTFTRGQAAKMLAYMMLGETAAEALPARSDFSDVSADQWFSKYIGFGVSEGYLAGMGDGSFKPDDPVTGYQWAKMLLCALGYDAKTEGLEGNGYEINVAKIALSDKKLFEGNEGADYNANATREEAALYAFNMIQQIPVKYEGTTTVTINGVEVVIATGKAEDDGNLKFYEIHFTKLEPGNATADAFGRPAVQWMYDNKEVGTYADEPTLTYTTEVKGGKIYTDLGKPSNAVVDEYVVDGDAAAVITADFAIVSGNDKKIGGTGALTEVYKTDDAATTNQVEYTIVVTNTYIGEITDWNKAVTNSDGEVTTKENIELRQVNGGNEISYETTAFTEDNEGDYVLYTYSSKADVNTKAQSVAVPQVVENVAVTSYTDTTITAGGTTYNKAAKAQDVTGFSTSNTYDLYLDTYGNVIATVQHTDNAVAPNYIYITGVEAEKQTSQVVTDKAGYVAVEGILANGETVVKYLEVKTSTADGKPEAGFEKGDNYVTVGSTYYNLTNNSDITNLNGTALTDTLYTYKVKGEDIAITAADTAGTTANETVGSTSYYSIVKNTDNDTITVKKGIANITGYGYVNASTNLVLVDGSTVTTITGYANFPSEKTYTVDKDGTEATDVDAIIVLKEGIYITDIIVYGAKAETESDSVVAVYKGSSYSASTDDGYVTYYEFYVDGEVKAYEVASIAGINKGDIVTLDFDSDGEATVAKISADGAVSALGSDYRAFVGETVDSIDSEYIVLNNGSAIQKGSAVVYNISDMDDFGTDELAKDDTITVVYKTDSDTGVDTATVIFITAEA